MEKYYRKALEFDGFDSLAGFSQSFAGEENMIYLDGNSLGKLPKQTADIISNVVNDEWGHRLIRSWNEKWMDLPERIAGKIARVVGARADEIFVGDSTSLNLFKLAFAALKSNEGRSKIISDDLNFPADLYVLQGLVNQHFKNHEVIIAEASDGLAMTENDLAGKFDRNTALVTLSHVAYRSSFMYDMKRISDLAHQHGSLIIWDLSHAAGSVPVKLNECNADMAVGCTYKYLNGGPGAPAFLYVRKELQEELMNPVWSWFAHEKPFDFDMMFKADKGIHKFAVGTPSILSLSAIEPGLDLLLDAGIDNLREKSVLQSGFLIDMILKELIPLGFQLASPVDDQKRGSHVTIQHMEGYRINRAMIEPIADAIPVIPDFRPPDNIRLGIAPLYNSFMDLYYTIERLKSIVENREFEHFSEERLQVT